MPYIPLGRRDELRRGRPASCAGDLNFQICSLIDGFLPSEPCYDDFNEVMGVLQCASLEVYRRLVAHYEDKKIQANGDVFTERP